jgi:RNA polymerase sigma-70 factor (ECF subfamily)
VTEKEFAGMVGSTKAVVLAAVRRHLAPRFFHAVDDAVQETYLRAFRALKKDAFRGRSSVGSWLYEIAKNESIRLTRKLAREERKNARAGEALLAGKESHASAEQEEIERMKERIEALPKKYRQVLLLVCSGRSEQEIAASLSIARGTVKSRVHRGRALLQRSIEGGKAK